jgi:hypothetical protein
MITNLSVERFKSIRSLSIPCRKVNVFIGAPDTGKTNLLEALYLLSRLGWNWPLDTSLRIRQEMGFDALFHRQFFDKPLVIKMALSPPYPRDHQTPEVIFSAAIAGGGQQLSVNLAPTSRSASVISYGQEYHMPSLDWIRFYSYTQSSYTQSESWQYSAGGHQGASLINAPHGYNLLYIARHDSRVYEFLKEIVAGLNWRVKFDQSQRTFRLSEVRADEIVDYNLDLLSDSLKRLFFYGSILKTSENAVLVLDEPDVFAFPPYPKSLGEMIGADQSNQLFLTTHNPYFLAGLMAKTRVEDLAVFVCYRDTEGATATKLLSAEALARMMELGASVFFNLDDFVS